MIVLHPVFVLCDRCYWSATYLDKIRPKDNDCPQRIVDNIQLANFPIVYNESHTFDMIIYIRIELKFDSR